MTTKSLEQIAQEAVMELCVGESVDRNERIKINTAIILAACEKAKEQFIANLSGEPAGARELITPQPQRSEPVKTVFTHGTDAEAKIPRLKEQPPTTDKQAEGSPWREWTPERVKRYYFGGGGDEVLAKDINAALAAARQEGIDWADKQYYGVSGQQRIRELEQQLAAEREARKPLVELLRSVHTWFMQKAPQHYNGCGLWIDVDAELSEHPRMNCILDVDSPTLPPEKEEYLQCGCSSCRDALAKDYPLPDGRTK